MPTNPPRARWRRLRFLALALAFAMLGGIAALAAVAVIVLNNKPDLKVWHTQILADEFKAGSGISDLEAYLALEERLFAELRDRIYNRIDEADRTPVNRFNAGSMSDPANPRQWPRNWNRTFELEAGNPRFSVLLLHGLSDSPYSLRSLGTMLHEEGGHVLGLRIPGHGTAPSGLVETTYEDMAAAVRLAVRHLHDANPGLPIIIAGYSNGGALAVHYTLESLANEALPQPSGLVLLSPEIGLSPIAAYAKWQARIGHWMGLDKLAWNSVELEYDPFKYGSFAVNAGDQAYRLTAAIQAQIDDLQASGGFASFPPTLAFQSVADATISAPALVTNFFDRIPDGNHELVAFDVNRVFETASLLREPFDTAFLFDRNSRPGYAVSLVTNRNAESREVVLKTLLPGETDTSQTDLALEWPEAVYSLSHIALPFSADDPAYGNGQSSNKRRFSLGSLVLRGENRTLALPNSAMTRLHWNPFFPFLEIRMRHFANDIASRPTGATD
ncbi:alpha/beta fold hydrolase [Stappia sp. GBMRC 2046]|uniref:Alpha/beta fold hydrolase n=1 Tax=Stappia sediminis TaxID=2692190 RepID=A0A7X3S8Z2_9HYPH|nr:alpha/beta fold hydrolase [Stappia sediminis]MXN66328.1 alpha/beta fold hydrolase [Stappia sediminis]